MKHFKIIWSDQAEIELDKIFEIPIIEFLNFISYVNWKNKYMEKKYKKNGI